MNKPLTQIEPFSNVLTTMTEISQLSFDYMALIFFSSIIASFGLLLNSSAVIIGAMLIAPLMNPILAVAFSSLFSQKSLLLQSVVTLITGILSALVISVLIGLIFNGVGVTPEELARTKPNIMDLVVALSAGGMGGFVHVRRSMNATAAGVAIAISLMPPLCCVGLGLAQGNPSVYLGASLLFATNVACVLLSAIAVFLLLDMPYFKKSFRAFIVPILSVLLLAVPLIYNFQTVLAENQIKTQISHLLSTKTETFKHVQIARIELDHLPKVPVVTVMVRSTQFSLNPSQVKLVENYLGEQVGYPVRLIVQVAPIIEITSDPEPPLDRDGLLQY